MHRNHKVKKYLFLTSSLGSENANYLFMLLFTMLSHFYCNQRIVQLFHPHIILWRILSINFVPILIKYLENIMAFVNFQYLVHFNIQLLSYVIIRFNNVLFCTKDVSLTFLLFISSTTIYVSFLIIL